MDPPQGSDSLVVLTEDHPDRVVEADLGRQTTIIGSAIIPEAAHGSGLITGISHTTGFATLPSVLTHRDVRLWQDACLLECTPSTEQLGALVQIAELLDDVNVSKWVDMLAERVRQCDWADAGESDAVLFSLLGLPSHLQQRVLVACLARSALDDMLEASPDHLHQLLFAACISTGSLTLPKTKKHFAAALSQLRTTQRPPPGPLTLVVPAGTTPFIADDASIDQLSHTLSATPSINHVSLTAIEQSVRFYRQLRQGLCTNVLPGVVKLGLSMSMHPHGCAELALCLRHLPALTRLDVGLWCFADAAHATQCPDAYSHLHGKATRLPCLKQLSFTEGHSDLDLLSSSMSVVSVLLPILTAPMLTFLRLVSDITSSCVKSIAASLKHLTAVKEIYLHVDMHPEEASPPCLSVAGATLPQLQRVSIHHPGLVCPIAIAAIILPLTTSALTELQVRHRTKRHLCLASPSAAIQQATTKPSADGLRAAWADLLLRLGNCSSLRHLRLDCLCSSYDGVTDEGFSEALSATLQQLRQLTALQLLGTFWRRDSAAECELKGEALGGALQHLQSLQRLRLVGSPGQFALVGKEHVLDALQGLPQLTRLAVSCATLGPAHVSRLLPRTTTLTKCVFVKMAADEVVPDEDAAMLARRFREVDFEMESYTFET